MPEQLKPDALGATLADLNRRLQILEATARVGLSQLRFCRSTAGAVPSVFGSYEYGTIGNTWRDDRGATGTGYPTITTVTPSKVLVMCGHRIVNVGNAAGFRTSTAIISVKIDASPTAYLQSQYYQANIDRMYLTAIMVDVLTLTPGSHTFTIGANWTDNNPAAGTLPQLSDEYLIVLPLSAA